MKHLSILVPKGQSNLSSIVGTIKILSTANDYFVSVGKKGIFKIQLVGCSKKIKLFDGLFSIHPQINFRSVKKTDLIIIPALKENLFIAIKKNKTLGAWVVRQYKQKARVVCIGTGSFLLASTGLMNGLNCSTHWIEANTFRRLFPDVNLDVGKLITEDRGIFTCGGGYSFLNLLLYLIEKYYNKETAVYCSKLFEIDIEHNWQSPFVTFSGQKDHEDEVIKKAQLYIESNAGNKLSVGSLASRFVVGRRSFDRRFKKATGNSPMEYIQRVNVETAKKCLEMGRKSVSDVMRMVGYSDRKAFGRLFKNVTGLSPLNYRKKYNMEKTVRQFVLKSKKQLSNKPLIAN
jgi:transcriptional regulator GlxA family with amidase domain